MARGPAAGDLQRGDGPRSARRAGAAGAGGAEGAGRFPQALPHPRRELCDSGDEGRRGVQEAGSRGNLALHPLPSHQLRARRPAGAGCPRRSQPGIHRAVPRPAIPRDLAFPPGLPRPMARGEQHRQPGKLPIAPPRARGRGTARAGRAGAGNPVRLARPAAGALDRLLGRRSGAQPADGPARHGGRDPQLPPLVRLWPDAAVRRAGDRLLPRPAERDRQRLHRRRCGGHPGTWPSAPSTGAARSGPG